MQKLFLFREKNKKTKKLSQSGVPTPASGDYPCFGTGRGGTGKSEASQSREDAARLFHGVRFFRVFSLTFSSREKVIRVAMLGMHHWHITE